jgi:SAM-dependent methyltransferase
MSVEGETNLRPADARSDPGYPLRRSQEEYERLSQQAAFLAGTTERLFRAAGIAPGMRVLDVGSGAGDVAILVAELVGPEGQVVGVESDRAALHTARGRIQSLGLSNVTLVEGDARTVDLDGVFDAVVGRLVLMYLADPIAALRRLVLWVRPGGLVTFQEFDFNPTITSLSLPDETLWNHVGGLVIETFARAGTRMRMGRHLFGAFRGAGLGAPTMRDESVVGGGRDFAGYEWLAGVARSLAPMMAKSGIADVSDLSLDTLADRLRDDTVASDAVVWTPSLVGAYTRTPVD